MEAAEEGASGGSGSASGGVHWGAETLPDQLAIVQKMLQELQCKLYDFTERVQHLAMGVDELAERLQSVETQLSAVDQKMGDMPERIRAGVDAGSVHQLKPVMQEITTMMDQLPPRVEMELPHRLRQLRPMRLKIAGMMVELVSRRKTLMRRLDDAAARVTPETARPLRHQVEWMRIMFDTCETFCQRAREKMNKLDVVVPTVASLGERLADLQSELGTLNRLYDVTCAPVPPTNGTH